jgi:hypothetical protein
MATQEQLQFRGQAESRGFAPIAPTSSTSAVKENAERLNNSLDRNGAMAAQNIERNYQASVRNIDGVVKSLSQFSSTLGEIFEQKQKEQNERDEEEGLMLAFTEGLPEEQMQHFNEQEAKLIQADGQTRAIAGSIEAEGGNPFVAERFRDLSGWKAYGYARGLAMKGGVNYPLYYAQAAQNTSVVINGQEVTLDTAKTPAERAAVEAQIRRGFIRNFMGINPALLNKYLFPQMLDHENRQALEWNDKQAKILVEQRKAESQDELYIGINSGRGGQTVIDFINRYAGDFGGVGNARRVVREMLEEGIKTRAFDPSEIDNILNYEFTARDGRKVRLGDYWGRDFGHLPDLQYEASRVELQRDLQAQQDAKAQFQLLFDQQTAEKLSKGEAWSEAELKAMQDNWTAQGLGAPPDFLLNYQSREDIDEKAAKETLMQLRQSRGYLTEEDLRGVSPKVYQEMIGYVRQDADIAKPSEEMARDVKSEIEARVSAYRQETDGQKEKTPEWYRTRNDAIDGFARYYRENIRTGMTPQQARDAALIRVQKNLDVGSYGKPLTATVDQQARVNLYRAREAISANPNLVNTGVIPGTEAALQQAKAYSEGKIRELPEIYHQLAEHHRGLTAWDIANAQLQAAGMGGLIKPRVEQAVDQLDPTLRPLLTWRPTAARTNRVALQTGWKQFLDLIASEESAAYGHYDAMNRGGAAGGTVAYGSANSTNVFGRGLSQMTIGEVMQLHKQGKLHAAGRYQFIASTLNEVMTKGGFTRLHGLTANDAFDASNQDKLAVALAQHVMTATNSRLSGLRGTWIGLKKVPDATLQNAINNIRVQSPFNRPENLHPRLVYRIGNRGYGSTGPHLDVKPVVPGGTRTSGNLPAMTANQLDQYVVVGTAQKPLSQGTVTTDDDRKHRNRGSYGHDFAADDGTPVYLKNGARVVGTYKGDGGTDHTIIELPDGRRYQFLHGLNA